MESIYHQILKLSYLETYDFATAIQSALEKKGTSLSADDLAYAIANAAKERVEGIAAPIRSPAKPRVLSEIPTPNRDRQKTG
jgi:hypothetical protein